MSRIWKLGALMLVIGTLATRAVADDNDNPITAGHKGTITAWNEAGDKVIAHKICPRRRGIWDYVACGNALRDELKLQLCAKGPGTYKYLYQVGDGRKGPSSLYCPK